MVIFAIPFTKSKQILESALENFLHEAVIKCERGLTRIRNGMVTHWRALVVLFVGVDLFFFGILRPWMAYSLAGFLPLIGANLALFALIGITESVGLTSKERIRFWAILLSWFVATLLIVFYMFHFVWITISGFSITDLDIALITYLTVMLLLVLPCTLAIAFNIWIAPKLIGIFLSFLSQLLKLWGWIQMRRKEKLETLPSLEEQGIFQRFMHCLAETTLANLWLAIALDVVPFQLPSEFGWLRFFLMIGLSLSLYPLFIAEILGARMGTQRIGPQILHKLWSFLAVLTFLAKFLSTFSYENIIWIFMGICVYFQLFVGLSLAFVCSQTIVVRRLNLLRFELPGKSSISD